ncbi:poly [ADP-ribose] polymerase 14-like isoform X2 [Paramuricea clavata]|uniref:Poly [ADP-ribose] polymerase 14-like isoform X2 n=1 Tax=Paramuricea clavata TaxID=317549 RepID=A0A7D9DSZ8_PARCT|nr:poly [ADP-ribose] polymerase 14-like isoform X2 [Paramuricea clavata]
MAGLSEPSFDAKRMVVVSKFPSNVGENELTIHFQKKGNSGGGEVNDVVLVGRVAFVTFDSHEVATSVLNHSEQVIYGQKIEVQSYESWLTNKKIQEGSSAMDNQGRSQPEDAASKDTQNVLKVSTVFEPTHDRSILLAKNLNPKTSKETLQKFVESKKNVDVFNVVFGKDGKAIVILKNEIDKDYSKKERSNKSMKLDGSIISLEFAPLTKGIRISNIPRGTRLDYIRFIFSNTRIGGGPVTDMMLDRRNGVANVYFEKMSVVSELVKKDHKFKDVPLTVIPYYDDFEELQEIATKITVLSGNYHIDPLIMNYLFIKHEIQNIFDFATMKYNQETSRFDFTKEFDDPKLAQEFENKLKEFVYSFIKDEVRIPKTVFETVKEAIEEKKAEFEAEKINFSFDGYRVIFIGKKEDVTLQKRSAEATIDKSLEKAKFEATELVIDDKNKLKFLNFIDYFKNVMTEFPGVKIHGMESSSGKLSLLGTAEKSKDVILRILQDLRKISEIDVKMSDRQIDFLKRTECQIVNDELKKDDVMLMLLTIKEHVEAKAFQAKIMTLKKCDNYTEEKRLLNIVHAKTSEKLVKVDEETASFLAKSDKLQKFKKEKFEQHQVFIDQELKDPCNIWIVCKESMMKNAEQELTCLTDEMKIARCKFKPMNPMEIRFLKEHCLGKIKEKEKYCEAEGVAVLEIDSGSLEVKGTQAGRKEMITFLLYLAGQIDCKAYPVTEPGMKKLMGATNVIISEIEKSHKCVIESNTHPEETDGKTKGDGGATSTMNLPYQSMSFVNDKEIDVIVNTTNHKVDLNGNSCGRALLKVAGKELLSECQRIGSLKPGEMAPTGPAKLNCKRVYHVRASPWNNGKGAQILRTLIKKCLDQVEKDKLRSIAIPAIGTGNLHCPRPDVTKILFEEVTGFFNAHPQSTIGEVHFVAFNGDHATVDAFLDAHKEIRSVILSRTRKHVPVVLFRNKVVSNAGSQSNVTFTEKHDGSLELSLGSGKLTVQIVCDDISKERTDLIMHVTRQDFSVKGGVAKSLIKAGGNSIIQECKALGKPTLYSTQYTKAGRLAVRQIAHVIAPSSMKVADLRKCLDTFFDDVSKKNIARVSFSAIGAGAMGYSERQSADLIFDSLSRIAKSKNHALSLIRIVILEKAKFTKFKDATQLYFFSRGTASSSPRPVDACASHSRKPAESVGGDESMSIRIYSDDREKIGKAWIELERKISQNIHEKNINNDVIKNFTDRDLEKLHELERDNDVKIKVDKSKGMLTIKGYIADVANVQEKIIKFLTDIKGNESKASLSKRFCQQVCISIFKKMNFVGKRACIVARLTRFSWGSEKRYIRLSTLPFPLERLRI